jgi:hypothetical protein
MVAKTWRQRTHRALRDGSCAPFYQAFHAWTSTSSVERYHHLVPPGQRLTVLVRPEVSPAPERKSAPMHKMSTERAREVKQALRGVLKVRSELRADPSQLVRAAPHLKLMNTKSKSIIQGQIGSYR